MRSALVINAGPFCYKILTSISEVKNNIFTLYSDYKVDGFDSNDLVDFYISIESTNIFRNIFRKQAQFYLDNKVVFNPFPFNHAFAMLEWGMNWCVSTQIHTYLILHAAVIEKHGYTALLPAPPGSGKSTLCASLVLEGWRLLSDELALINLSNFNVVPFPRPVSLKNQSIEIIQKRYPDSVFGSMASDTLKGNVCHLKPPRASIHKQFQESPIAWVIFPKYVSASATEVTKRSRAQSFIEVANNAFNYSLLGVDGFEVLKHVIDRSSCFDFKYSCLDEAVHFFENLEIPREF
jgi:HprK-related kinase A